MIIELILMLLALVLCFFFAFSEASMVAANQNLFKRMASAGDRKASAAHKLINNRNLFFGTILLGTNLAIVAFTTIGEYLTAGFGESIHWVLIRILVFDGIILIIGEIMPKSIALENPDKFALANASKISFVGKILSPIVTLVNYVPSLLIKDPDPDLIIGKFVSERQFKLAIQEGHQAGIVDEESKDIGMKVIDFAETTIDRVMTLRGDIVSLPAEITVREAYDRIREHGFSRIPIYADKDEDNVVGFLSVKDLIRAFVSNEHDKTLSNLKRNISFVPFRKKVLDMMLDFKKEHSHIAMVVDEAGNITGLITLEDLLEEVVGEIYDEYDKPEEIIKKLGPDTYIVDGKLEVETINENLGLGLDETGYESIGGFVMGLFGRVPREGMTKQHAKAKFTIMKMDDRRIEQIKIKIDRNGNGKHSKQIIDEG